ncbi:uncharacterized protein LOC141614752 [Silene latifolia]|uniref:uncharacterized protein LOC141614752 n=1 Tax=Silene latifolia TaxID=37657 RepID=UPI003D76DA1B
MEGLVSKKRKRCTRTFHYKRCKCEGQRHMLPDEMWLDILTRLPIKSLFISRTVSSSWNILATNISNKINIPQCGFFLGSLSTYICLESRKATNLYTLNAPEECVLSSGYDTGYLADLAFDFGDLFKNAAWRRNWVEENLNFCTVSRGLLIFISEDDGELHVKNPVTREAFIVPKTNWAEEYGWGEDDFYLVVRGFETSGYSNLLIVRYQESYFGVEYYCPGLGRWFRCLSDDLDDDLRGSELLPDSCVTVKINERRMIFILTKSNCGIVIKVPTGDAWPALAVVCRFRLPETVNDEQGFNTKLGKCGECVYLSHLRGGCLSVWKHNYNEVDDTWVLLRRINISRRLKVVTADDPVSNLGFHEDSLIVYISTKSSIFSYCLADDTLKLIVQLNGEDSQTLLGCNGEPEGVVPFTPFLGSLTSPNKNYF